MGQLQFSNYIEFRTKRGLDKTEHYGDESDLTATLNVTVTYLSDKVQEISNVST